MHNVYPVGLQLYSVRDSMAEDFAGTLQKTKALGFDGVEFAGLFGHSAEEVKQLLREYQLKPVSAHVPIADMLAAPDEVMQTYAAIGCPYISVPWLDADRRPGGALFAETLEAMNQLAALAKPYQLTLLYHNHDFEFAKIGDQFVLDYLYQQVSQMESEIDTCWVSVAGVDPAAYIRQYTGHAPVVHLKDYAQTGPSTQRPYELIGQAQPANRSEDDTFAFRPVGEGLQSFAGILQAARDAGTLWLVIEQDRPTQGMTSWECAAKSIANLRQLMETL